jgi:hypothetical protein
MRYLKKKNSPPQTASPDPESNGELLQSISNFSVQDKQVDTMCDWAVERLHSGLTLYRKYCGIESCLNSKFNTAIRIYIAEHGSLTRHIVEIDHGGIEKKGTKMRQKE